MEKFNLKCLIVFFQFQLNNDNWIFAKNLFSGKTNQPKRGSKKKTKKKKKKIGVKFFFSLFSEMSGPEVKEKIQLPKTG
jgi:hypothetical protein